MKKDSEEIISEIVRRLVKAAHPLKLILFGSYAKGTENEDSDFDILVIEENVVSRYQEILKLRKSLRGIMIPIDLLVISEADFKERSELPSNVYYWANKEGKVIYETV